MIDINLVMVFTGLFNNGLVTQCDIVSELLTFLELLLTIIN